MINQDETSKNNFNDIHSNAQTIYEIFSCELKKGNIPQDISFHSLNFWANQVRCRNFALKDRVSLFKSPKFNLRTNDQNWFFTYKAIAQKYNPKFRILFQKSRFPKDQPFHLLILPFIHHAQERSNWASPSIKNILSKKAYQSCLEHLRSRLYQASVQSFYSDFSNHEKTNHDTYCTLFYNQYSTSFFQEYSSLARLLTTLTTDWIRSITLFINHFKKDKVILSQKFFAGEKLRSIKSISIDAGPDHSHLGPNRVVTFSNNRKLVYKTKSAQNDLFYNRLILWSNKVQKKIKLETYKVCDCKKYSWHEYVPNNNCKSVKEINKFYERIGYISAFLQILGSTDYHFGNIIAKGGQPIFIDHETVLNFNGFKRKFNIKEANILSSHESQYNLLGVFNYKVSQPALAFRLTEKGKIKKHFKKVFWTGSNIPSIANKKVNPSKFKNQIISGYAMGLGLISKQQNSFIKFIKKELISLHINHRYLNRSSLEYLNFLEESYDPFYMKSGIHRSLHFEGLFQLLDTKKVNAFSLYIISQEISNMNAHYWPRFILNKKEIGYLEKEHKGMRISKKNFLEIQVIPALEYLQKRKNQVKQVETLSKLL